MLRGHVLPELGRVKVCDLRRRHVKAFLAKKRADDYAKNSVRLMRAALSTVLTDAMDDEIVTFNAALSLGRKKDKRDHISTADRHQATRPISRPQMEAFLAVAAAERAPYGMLFRLLIKAGLRPGEAFALTPGDLDLDGERTVRVERALSGRTIKDTKTHGVRAVDLTDDVIAHLRRHLTWLAAETLRLGWGEAEWLFPNEANQPLDIAKSRKVFRRVLKRAKLPGFRVYDCRHTYASARPPRRP